MLNMVRLSGSAVLQSLIVTTSWVALIRILASFGSAALAGYTIAIRIVLFALLPAWGLANAAATLVGQNLGAGKPERAAHSGWVAFALGCGVMSLMAAVFFFLAEPMFRLFCPYEAQQRIVELGAEPLSGPRHHLHLALCIRWRAHIWHDDHVWWNH